MKKILFSALIAVLALTGVKAQQDPAYSMYMFNGLFINPAYTGSQEVISVMGIYRHQWAGIEGAPRTANISVHTPLRRDQYAIGAIISNDKIGLSNTFSFTPSFAYRLKIKQSRLCFGISASFAYFYQGNTNAVLNTDNDQSFSVNENMFVPNVGFGIYAYGKRYFIGVSAPHLMPTGLSKKTSVVGYNPDVARVYDYLVFNAGYVFGKDAAIVKFRPSVLVKWQQGLPNNIPQFDASLGLLFIDRFWLGATYRTGGDMKYYGQSAIVWAQFKITPQLQLGYAYDAEISGLRKFTSGTHEIMLGYNFWYDKKRFVTPRYVKYF